MAIRLGKLDSADPELGKIERLAGRAVAVIENGIVSYTFILTRLWDEVKGGLCWKRLGMFS